MVAVEVGSQIAICHSFLYLAACFQNCLRLCIQQSHYDMPETYFYLSLGLVKILGFNCLSKILENSQTLSLKMLEILSFSFYFI